MAKSKFKPIKDKKPDALNLTATVPGQPDTGKPVGLNDTNGPTGGALSVEEIIRRSNLWRDNYNPLVGLSLTRLKSLFEFAERGAFAEIQLVLRKSEKRFPILKGFIEKLLSCIEELPWDVKIKKNLPAGATKEMAEKQQTFLRARYDLLQNFTNSISQIALAEIRGYAILQKHRYKGGENDGAVRELYWIEPWCWSRDGFYGDFYYNEISRFGVGLGSCASTLGENNRIGSDALPRSDFVIREVESPLYEIALIAFVNWLMGRKDYAAFTEIFGLPNSIVVMPPNIAPGKEQEYQQAAEKVAGGVSGSLPHGSDVKFPTSAVRGEDPFEKYCSAQEKDVVLAGTGGELTMLSKPTGIGKGAAGEHDASWQKIAVTKARRISQTLNRDFDAAELAAEFPNEPVCVEFFIGIEDEEDVKELVDVVVSLDSIGMKADVATISDRTGLKLTYEPQLQQQDAQVVDRKVVGTELGQAIRNRAWPAAATNGEVESFAAAVGADVVAVLDRLQAITEIKDDSLFEAKLKDFYAQFPQLQNDILKDPHADRAMLPIITKALLSGLKAKPVANPKS